MIDVTKRSYNPAKRFAYYLSGRETSALAGSQSHLDKIGYDQAAAIASVEQFGRENGQTRGPGEPIREFISRLTGLPVEQLEQEIPLFLKRCDGAREESTRYC